MPFYEDVTNTDEIQRQIDKNLYGEVAAREVLRLIKELCSKTETTSDPMSQWLGLLAGCLPKVQKWRTSDDLVEIYPCGTKGNGKSDRLLFQVGETQVAVVQAYESKH